MKKSLFLCGILVLNLATVAHGQGLGAINTNWTVNAVIPEGNPVGMSISETFQNLNPGPMTDVSVNLDISGGYNGALYGALILQEANGNTATEVLLNQMGTSPSNPLGSSGAGLDVTLSDTGTVNGSVHWATGIPTGTWLPDSANTLAGAFDGLTANGTWTLILADLDDGTGTPTLVSWGLEANVAPEPAAGGLAGLGGLLLLAGQRLVRCRRS